ncbi:MAG: winged helix-turn-helix domain-containing protein [Phycisphaeraceae bacterium]|nr:winged helix-turn-helix domain-containing protein [Phycisphaeraceae bacterium]MCW5762902.1 winged helix-turn-helix domain-containing protein [Phycisphaeraceae bacterium]
MTTKKTSAKSASKKTATKSAKKPPAKKPSAVASVMKKVAAEDAAKAKARESAATVAANEAGAALHTGTVKRSDGREVRVSVPANDDAKAPTTPAPAKSGKKPKAGPKTPARAAPGDDAPKAKKEKAPKPPKKPSGLDLAAKVLAEAREPLSAKAIAERAIAAGWVTSGKTPHATLYAAIIREIASKGDAARFTKTDRRLFEAGPSTKKGA